MKYRDPDTKTGKIFAVILASLVIGFLVLHTIQATHPGPAPTIVEATPSAWEDGRSAGCQACVSATPKLRRAPTPMELAALADRASTGHTAFYGHSEEWNRGFREGYDATYSTVARPAF